MIPLLFFSGKQFNRIIVMMLPARGGEGVEIPTTQSVMINYKPRPRYDDHRNNCNQRLFIIEFTSLQ